MDLPSPGAEEARRELRVAAVLAGELAGCLARASKALEGVREDGLQTPAEDLPPVDPWIAQHRPGTRSKIDRDPELEAFVRARLDRMTLQKIAEEIARRLPPGRRASFSSLHRWWHKRCAPSRRGQM